jgi:hypothetical protein
VVTMWQPHYGRLSHLMTTMSSLMAAASHHTAAPV